MKKSLLAFMMLMAVLGVVGSQVDGHATAGLTQTEQKIEAKRLGRTHRTKWTAQRHVTGEALRVNRPNMRALTAIKFKTL